MPIVLTTCAGCGQPEPHPYRCGKLAFCASCWEAQQRQEAIDARHDDTEVAKARAEKRMVRHLCQVTRRGGI